MKPSVTASGSGCNDMALNIKTFVRAGGLSEEDFRTYSAAPEHFSRHLWDWVGSVYAD